ncbi:conserved membrane hypothetical protein [Paraburkholderia unamae]|uniref:hypothetical protein n=1 Tax=Paraburkholderia unamae TaxID=219649 RepID=UPI000DC3A06F|nr:hypothetical protein [Paraburkholderia unamae]RAR66835.1 hypothetical protein C7401_102260 [Paraburkholderia unamae]CAG9273134.1 conserved membrane hypothetical protein [Paraburkholderia unamae]
MMHGHPVDRLVAGAIVGALVTAILVLLLVWLDIPPEKQVGLAVRLAVPVLISACALLIRPLLFKTVLRERRDPLMLEEDLNQLLVGRALGVVGGFFFGVTLATQLL